MGILNCGVVTCYFAELCRQSEETKKISRLAFVFELDQLVFNFFPCGRDAHHYLSPPVTQLSERWSHCMCIKSAALISHIVSPMRSTSLRVRFLPLAQFLGPRESKARTGGPVSSFL